jgi:hypothetical protein
MKIYEWKDGMSLEESKDGAYWERNMLALLLARTINGYCESQGLTGDNCGWYYDTDNNCSGWKRVISIAAGSITFHIPDNFDVGDLPQIKPNWDGYSTKKKWLDVMENCGCNMEGL